MLALKGLDALYDSRRAIEAALDAAFADEAAASSRSTPGVVAITWATHVQVIGDDLPAVEMAALYRGADAYVSASMAEGFQMPLAEATAAGLPVIVPIGGAAEEVIDPGSAVLVPAATVPRVKADGILIQVEEQELAKALDAVLHGTSAHAQRAPTRGPLWAARHLSMQHSTVRLLAEVMARRAH